MPRSAIHRNLVSSLLSVALLMISTRNHVVADDGPPVGASLVRQTIEQKKLKQQESQKELTLKQGAVTVASQRVAEIEKQLADAKAREAAEVAQVQQLQEMTAALDKQVAELTAALPQHEAADALIVVADKATARLSALQTAQKQLQSQLATLRKSSVEWRSKATDAEQQIAAITAQRPELDKKAAETKAAADAAETTVVAAQTAMTAVQTTHDAVAATMSAEEERLKSATASVMTLANSVASLEKSLATLREAAKLTGIDSTAAIQGLEKAIADFAPLKSNTDALVAQITARRDEQNKLLAAAKTELEKKSAELKAAVAAAEPLRTAQKAANDALAAANTREAAMKIVKAEGDAWQKTLQSQLTGLEPSLQKLNAEMQIVSNESLVARRQAESALEPLGRFVSFSRHVAPIFAERCIACHNTRSPGGRLNMDSFAALSKGGESGAAVAAHKTAESLLLTMIEDGSMPKDADPLKPEEIAIVRHWIEVGAPLDAGIPLTADLFDVMPERSQPLPPNEYRVAIPVTAVAFNTDGSQLASSGYREVLVWNTTDGSLIRRISNVAERIYDVEFSADGSSLAVAAGTPGQLGELKIFSAADGSLIRTLVRSRDAIFALSFSPDGKQLACAGADRSIYVVDVASGQEVTRIEDHADWVMDINWSPNGQRLVSSSRDKTCKVFDAATGNPVITFPGHGEPVYSGAFLADGTTVVSGGGDKRLRVWNSADAKEVRAIGGFGGDVFRVLIQPGDIILSASGDRAVHQNKAADGAEIRKLAGHNDWVYTLSANAGRKLIASGSYDGEIRLWNAEDGTMTTSFIAVPKGQQSVAAATAN
jgi:predicted  nucleic acid-binding Zn-ribbon protein